MHPFFLPSASGGGRTGSSSILGHVFVADVALLLLLEFLIASLISKPDVLVDAMEDQVKTDRQTGDEEG